MDFSPRQRGVLLDAARAVIRDTLRRDALGLSEVPRESLADPDSDPVLLAPAGCFVSLHGLRSHRLRGCVGRLDATTPLIEAVRSAARSVLSDPRFAVRPVEFEELPDLEIEISVISPLRDVADCLNFEPALHGIYLTVEGRSGCFLPQVARETGWTREQLLSRLCTEKIGVAPDAWQNGAARLQVFQSVTIGPEPFVQTESMKEAAAGREA